MSSLICSEYHACNVKMSLKAKFYCVQCKSLQCTLCEKEIHENMDSQKHDRLTLEEIDGEYCSVNRTHQAVFYCPTCTLSFCYACYISDHQDSDKQEHKPQKNRNVLSVKKNK
jgi:hypothetical protein